MTIIVEDGSGVAFADVYATVAEADALATATGDPHSWVARTVADKEVALRLAASYLDRTFGRRYSGCRVDKDQSLFWPRTGASYNDGWNISNDELPVAVKNASIQAALRIGNSEDLEATPTTDGTIKGTSQKVGPLTDTIDYASPASGVAPPPREVSNTLAPVLNSPGRSERG